MQLEIVSPEARIFSGEVNSVTVSGALGSFQILNNHAPVVSTLVKGRVKIQGDLQLETEALEHFTKEDQNTYFFDINSGAIEMRNNKIILLTD
jgi:F-type H+-transporting ATPase subunit epsilon